MKKIDLTPHQKRTIGVILKMYIGDKSERRRINKIKKKKKRLTEQKKFYVDNGYSKFTSCKEEAYEVAALYEVDICPYCNMNCTHTVFDDNGKTVCRPDFEHFEPKSQVPWKAMNVMNIVPSCLECNERIKKEKPFRKRTHLHPYFDDFDSLATFELDIKDPNIVSNNSSFKILINTDDVRTENFIRDMMLRERYNFHKGIAQEIASRVSKRYNQDSEVRKALVKCEDPLDEILFPELKQDIKTNSFAKIKKDIVNFFIKK